jgi:ABC-2 type transport system permease protein
MLRSIATKTLRDTSRAMMWWAAGLILLVAMMSSSYPSIRDNAEIDKLIEQYPEVLKEFFAFGGVMDYSTGAGFLGSELFSIMVPLLFIIAAITAGARAIAGEEENGTLDLLLSLPLTRRRLVLEKLVALVVELAFLGIVLWLTLVVGAAVTSMDVSAGHLAAATLGAGLIGLDYGAIALLLGAATGRRGIAIGGAAATAVAAYLVNTLAPLLDVLHPLRRISPFYRYSAADPLREGLDAGTLAFLVAVAVLAVALAIPALDRRDLST